MDPYHPDRCKLQSGYPMDCCLREDPLNTLHLIRVGVFTDPAWEAKSDGRFGTVLRSSLPSLKAVSRREGPMLLRCCRDSPPAQPSAWRLKAEREPVPDSSMRCTWPDATTRTLFPLAHGASWARASPITIGSVGPQPRTEMALQLTLRNIAPSILEGGPHPCSQPLCHSWRRCRRSPHAQSEKAPADRGSGAAIRSPGPAWRRVRCTS